MDGEQLEIRAYEEPDRYVLVLTGELDLAAVAAFEAAAEQLCEMGARRLLVEITGVDFIDSSGLRAILNVKAECDRRDIEFSMTHGSGQAERLFELTRLVERLPFRKSGRTRPRRPVELSPRSRTGTDESGPEAVV
ncbi:MAG TPA: STAS domain-containing protein [Solirubrobacteraceae bacterium]|jgi:anti-sigma B factor antagonist|nr:STAS domain-containing protein [Solirubrobacteraceae bacterium]